jgi:hypothetical protein
MEKLIVNLASKDRTVHSKAELDKKEKVRLYWFLEPGPNNTPLKWVKSKDRGGFGEAGMMKFSMNTDSKGVCEHDDFRLSACGLDTFKVSVGSKKDGSDKKTNKEYEVWRRVYLSVRYMKPEFILPLDALHTEYRKHGIWPKEISPGGGSAKVAYKEVITKDTEPDSMMQPVTEKKLEGRVLLVDRIWLASFRQFTVQSNGRNIKFDVSGFVSDPQPGWMLWDNAKPGTCAAGGVGIGTYDVTPHMTRTGDLELAVKVPDGTPAATALDEAKTRGKLSWTFKVWFIEILNGFAYEKDGTIVIANRTRGAAPRPLAPRQGTVIHEVGHGLGMVPEKIQEYNEFNGNPIKSGLKKNPTQYQNGGGHCNTAAGGSDPNFTSGTCVMFHYGHNSRTLQFCPSCAPIVKRRNLNRADMKWP